MNIQDFLSFPKEISVAFLIALVVAFFAYLWLKRSMRNKRK